MRKVLCVAALALMAASGAQAANAPLWGGIRYDGHATCATTATLTVDATTVKSSPNSHTALWSGVANRAATEWLQAGLTSDTGTVYAYVEYAVGARYKLLRLGATSTATVKLARHGDVWTVTLGARSVSVKLPGKTTCFVGGESADWGSRNVLDGSVSVNGGDPFEVAL